MESLQGFPYGNRLRTLSFFPGFYTDDPELWIQDSPGLNIPSPLCIHELKLLRLQVAPWYILEP